MSFAGIPWPLRVRVWDAAFAAVREYLRGEGLREVSTSVRVDAVALEPWIDPLASEGRLLITSPELAMKQLLARGSGPVFQIAHVFRRAERGARHSEEFHLIEWYRERGDDPDALGSVMRDVEQIVARVFAAIAVELGDRALAGAVAPNRWERVNLLALMGETLGCEFVGNEPAEALESHLSRVRTDAGVGLPPHVAARSLDDPELARLLAWTELFSLWSDVVFEPWLLARGQGTATHVEGFPASLAALAELDANQPASREASPHGGRRPSTGGFHGREDNRCVGARFESHVGVVELANGYRELRDAVEQRRRFELVAAMRAHHRQAMLPMPEAFLAELGDMPACCGVALGLDRLVALACGCERLDQVALGI